VKGFVVLLGWMLAWPVFAQSAFPSRPIRILVPTTAGGVPDVLARSVGQRMAEAIRAEVQQMAELVRISGARVE